LTSKLHSRYVKESEVGKFGKVGVGKIWKVRVGVGNFISDFATLV